MKKNLLITAIGLLTACASVTEGIRQDITVITDPPGARCLLEREGITLATIEATPGTATVKKSKYDITVRCFKMGYQRVAYLDHSGSSGATLGNVIYGGLAGWAFDSAAGTDNKYQSPVNITLLKQ